MAAFKGVLLADSPLRTHTAFFTGLEADRALLKTTGRRAGL